MEYKEFVNPEERDYDIKHGLENTINQNNNGYNQYEEQLFDLIGVLEDFDENELIENYGITMQEYLKPTNETIKKVSEKLNSNNRGRSR